MIRLIRSDGIEILLNVALVKKVESTPETVITLNNGEILKVKNDIHDVLTKVHAYQLGYDRERQEQEQEETLERNGAEGAEAGGSSIPGGQRRFRNARRERSENSGRRERRER